MDPKTFKAPEAGRLIRATGGYFAFVPAPLPPSLTYDNELVLLLSQADSALSELSGVGRLLPNPYLLIEPYVRREAVLSSRIEGTSANLSDLLLEEIVPRPAEQKPDDVREVKNYVLALEHGRQRLKSLPLSLRLVRELHERLMRGVRGNQARPGVFRGTQNWIGSPGATLETATYVPPPVPEMHEALDSWEKFLHQHKRFPDLIQCALIHEQFEAIHPFLDGNGRVGRLLIPLFLIERKRLSQPLLYLSAFFEANQQSYYDLLQRVRTEGDWTSWLRFFLKGVSEIAKEAIARSAKLTDLRERYRKKLKESGRALRLLDVLFQNPYITVARAQKILKVTNPTARAAVGELQRARILEEISGRTWGRLYLAKPILRILER
ncbi:MAG TPA: Fic family protein [Thermoanaerobaculia bacterium]